MAKKSVILFLAIGGTAAVAAAVFAATGAPTISNIVISGTTSSSTVISWSTEALTDGLVNFALDNQYGTLRDANHSTKDHTIMLTGLDPGTTYYARIVATDPTGNQGISGDYTFTTDDSNIEGIQQVTNPTQKSATEKVVSLLDKLNDQSALTIVASKLNQVANGAFTPPQILGDPVLTIGSDRVSFRWSTDKPANSMVSIGTGVPYSETQGNFDEQVSVHNVTVMGLTPSTLYHFQVSSKGQIGEAGKSPDGTVTTKSLLASVVNVRITKIEEHAVSLSWNTTYPAAATVEYTNMLTRKTKTSGDQNFTASHSIRLDGLDFKTPYTVVVKAINQSGDQAAAAPVTFLTTKNEIPPVISHVTNESTLYADVDSKVQTIVSWDTDEPSFCQLFYNEGAAAGNASSSESLAEEADAGTKHTQVVTSFLPATVYHFWLSCKNLNGYDDRSEDYVLFTPQKEKNIVDIILENFQGTFGWLGKVGG